ncbi:MAG: hypothetical protein NZ807_00490, partial [Dehalococcoidia bacterium]|nr:hypothetical protein [Dehalococcoidia bacterium]
MKVADLVNLDAYPIQDIQSPTAQALVAKCRKDLDKNALCTLEDFVSAEALMVMKVEIDGLLNYTYRAEHERTPYSWRYNLDFPDGHPRRALHL